MNTKLPLSVIVITKNEERRMGACLKRLQNFDEVIVVDSNSTDQTVDIAKDYGARVANFTWNGAYPKKYQWCLEALDLKYDDVLFVDADELVEPALVEELSALMGKEAAPNGQSTSIDHSQSVRPSIRSRLPKAGYFIKARYVMNGKVLRYGLQNNKLALLNRKKMHFPVVDDLACADMGEIEGHYQPVLKSEYADESLGSLSAGMLHETLDDWEAWETRHKRYAAWEVHMDQHQAWPKDPSKTRVALKSVFKALPCRPLIAFCHSYIAKAGVLDGREGYWLACSRLRYYQMIEVLKSLQKHQ